MSKCGTNAGYQKHCVDKTEKCDPCREAHREYLNNYYAKNAQKLKFYRRNKYFFNPEKEINNTRIWRINNPNYNIEYQRKYRKLNPESKRSSERRRRANRFNNGFEYYKESEVLDLYGDLCHICNIKIDLSAPRLPGLDGWESGLHIDHVIPLSKGGPDTLDNVRPAHGACNVKKHANPFPNNAHNAIIN
jgi:5-methylcytosine-specific restriction endonuclease McrA